MLFLPWVGAVIGQSAAPQPTERSISSKAWQEAMGRLDYSRDVPVKETPKKAPPVPFFLRTSPPDTDNLWAKGMKYGLVMLLVIAVGWTAHLLLSNYSSRHSTPAAVEAAVAPPTDLEQRIHESDLPALLRQALAAGDYRQATRVHFLRVIRHLSHTGAIHWQQEKTNRQYAREIQDNERASLFHSAVTTFERIWYGNAPIKQAEYDTLVAPLFNRLLGI